jgi:cobalamin biosynthesis Mg chelatase CobN
MSPRDKEAKEQQKAAEQAGDEAAQEVKDSSGVGDRPPSDPQELREEIAETREGLGATVEAPAGKADVKTQAQEKVEQAKERPAPVAGIVAAIAAALLLVWLIRRR